LVASAGQDVYAYVRTEKEWKLDWRFRSSKAVLELHPVSWLTDEAPYLLVLAPGAVYNIRPDGTTQWRIDNNDLNKDAQPIHCGDSESRYVFGNIMSGVYTVNRDGLVRSWELPGGAFRLGFIPLPIPAHPNYGTTAADLVGDNQDEILVRSISKLFVFDCNGDLIAQQTIKGTQDENLVSMVRGAPHYRPFVVDRQIAMTTKGQIDLFSLEP